MAVRLRARWRALGKALALPPEVRDSVWSEIESRHGEPHRAYHNLTHLADMFAVLDEMTGGEMPPAVSLAVWFHDIVYDPTSRDNEATSAALLVHLLGDGVDAALLVETQRLILLTKMHETTPDDSNGRLLLDADLAILGAPRERYRQYAQAIRQEYAHVSDSDFSLGRTAMLDRFLQMPLIYHTQYAQLRLEQPARDNLRWEKQQIDLGS